MLARKGKTQGGSRCARVGAHPRPTLILSWRFRCRPNVANEAHPEGGSQGRFPPFNQLLSWHPNRQPSVSVAHSEETTALTRSSKTHPRSEIDDGTWTDPIWSYLVDLTSTVGHPRPARPAQREEPGFSRGKPDRNVEAPTPALSCARRGLRSAFAPEYRRMTWACYRRPQLAHAGRWMMTESSEASERETPSAFASLDEGPRGSLPQDWRTALLPWTAAGARGES